MIALDTNLLVYAHRAGTAEHKPAAAALFNASRRRDGWGLAFPVVAEFWKIVTHPKAEGGPSPGYGAASFLAGLFDAGARCWCPTPDTGIRLLEAAVAHAASGNTIFDLQIALLARENGATEIWTHDGEFPELAGLRRVDPLAGAA